MHKEPPKRGLKISTIKTQTIHGHQSKGYLRIAYTIQESEENFIALLYRFTGSNESLKH